jgi:Protein of unknown function (DUF2795)
MDADISKEIQSVSHLSTVDTESVNKSVERASKDRIFISNAIDQLNGLRFPAYKGELIDYLKRKSAKEDIISLFESLTDDRLYKDLYHVKKAIEQNNPNAKQDNQISDKTRKNLTVQKVEHAHKRKDYPQVPATAPKEYVCQLCGKSFQTRDDLIHHQQFESEKT